MEKRWIREARVEPEMAIFCNGGRSSMAEDGGEREKERVRVNIGAILCKNECKK